MASWCERCYAALRWPATVCASCKQWERHWNSLTPEEQKYEHQMMLDYVMEAEGV